MISLFNRTVGWLCVASMAGCATTPQRVPQAFQEPFPNQASPESQRKFHAEHLSVSVRDDARLGEPMHTCLQVAGMPDRQNMVVLLQSVALSTKDDRAIQAQLADVQDVYEAMDAKARIDRENTALFDEVTADRKGFSDGLSKIANGGPGISPEELNRQCAKFLASPFGTKAHEMASAWWNLRYESEVSAKRGNRSGRAAFALTGFTTVAKAKHDLLGDQPSDEAVAAGWLGVLAVGAAISFAVKPASGSSSDRPGSCPDERVNTGPDENGRLAFDIVDCRGHTKATNQHDHY